MSDSQSDSELVQKIYNDVGAPVMQRIFGEGWLAPRGEETAEQLARLAAPTQDTRVLDVGSGFGGAAAWLASHVGCSVTGLDVVASSVEAARALVASRGLDHLVRFEHGDATDMPFEADTFSMIWGQTAWCYAPDALLAECARVLEPGGTIVFTEFLLIGEEDDFWREKVLPAAGCPGFETLTSYIELLERHGFVDVKAEDVSSEYASHYQKAWERLQDAKDWVTENYGPRAFANVVENHGYLVESLNRRQWGAGQFLARLPA